MITTSSNRTPQLLDGFDLRGGGGRTLYLDGKPYLNFAGCNYLAMGALPELRDAAVKALDGGALFSRYLIAAYGGQEAAFDDVEVEAAKFFGTEAAVYMPSGYHVGAACIQAALPLIDTIVLDDHAHWCLQDAAQLSGKPCSKFASSDVADLDRALAALPPGARPLIATDGAFATSGELPPLDAYAARARDRGGFLAVDESHSAGIVGLKGRGACEHFGVEDQSFIGATLSKGLCAQGAVFVSSHEACERARLAPPLRGSNPGSPISASVSAAALAYARQHPERAAKTCAAAHWVRTSLEERGIVATGGIAPIVSFTVGDWAATRALQQALFDEHIYVLHSNYIAAGPGGLIRLSLFADHTEEDLARVVDAIDQAMPASGRQRTDRTAPSLSVG